MFNFEFSIFDLNSPKDNKKTDLKQNMHDFTCNISFST